jgi:hypothetical protein
MSMPEEDKAFLRKLFQLPSDQLKKKRIMQAGDDFLNGWTDKIKKSLSEDSRLPCCGKKQSTGWLIKKQKGGYHKSPIRNYDEFAKAIARAVQEYFLLTSPEGVRFYTLLRLHDFEALFEILEDASELIPKTKDHKSRKRKCGIPIRPKREKIRDVLNEWIDGLVECLMEPGLNLTPIGADLLSASEDRLIDQLYACIGKACPDLLEQDKYCNIARIMLQNHAGKSGRTLKEGIDISDDLILKEPPRIRKRHKRYLKENPAA